MRVMLFHKIREAALKLEPTPEMLEAFRKMDEFTEELVKAGVFVAAAGLKSSAQSKQLIYDGRGNVVVLDGPFTETAEVIAGFSIWEVKDMAEALAWIARFPASDQAGSLEVRPFLEAADMDDLLTAEDKASPRTGERGKLGVA